MATPSLNTAPAAAYEVPLYQATPTSNLESIARSGLDPSRGGTGGATDLAAALAAGDAAEQEAQRIRKLNSANQVHFGGYGTASTYLIGFKYLAAISALETSKRAKLIEDYKRETNKAALVWADNKEIERRLRADPEVIAAIEKSKQKRALLRMYVHRELGSYFDADPDESGQDAARGIYAVRTVHGIEPQMLSVHTSDGWIPLLDYHARLTKPEIVGPSGDFERAEHRENAVLFHNAIDKTLWHAKRKEEQEKAALVSSAAATSSPPSISIHEALAAEMARRASRRPAIPAPNIAIVARPQEPAVFGAAQTAQGPVNAGLPPATHGVQQSQYPNS